MSTVAHVNLFSHLPDIHDCTNLRGVPFQKGNIQPKPGVTANGIVMRLVPSQTSPRTYRCMTGVGTPDEHCWGLVFQDGNMKCSNDRGDGRVFRNMQDAGRDLIERSR